MEQPCPHCQVGHLKHRRTVYVTLVDGTLIHAPNVPAWQCDVCKLTIFDTATVRRIELLIGESGPPPNHHTPPARAALDEATVPGPDAADESRPRPD